MEYNIDTQQFFTWFLVLFVENQHLKVAKTQLCAAILCPAVGIGDVVNKAGFMEMCGVSIRYIKSQPFFLAVH